MSVGCSPPKRRETCRRGLEKEERRGKEKRGGGRVIFIGVLLFILEFGAGLVFFFLVGCVFWFEVLGSGPLLSVKTGSVSS